MDYTDIFGIILGFIVVFLIHIHDGSSINSLFNLSALAIVCGGSLAAIIIQTPKLILDRAMHILDWTMQAPNIDFEMVISNVLLWRKIATNDGLITIEHNAVRFKDDFLNQCLELLLGYKSDNLQQMLEYKIDS